MTILDSIKEKSQDGFTLTEIGQIFTEFLYDSVKDLMEVSISGPEKKKLVLQGFAEVFDIVAPSIPLPMWLTPFRVFLRPYIKQIVLMMADGVIEVIYSKLK